MKRLVFKGFLQFAVMALYKKEMEDFFGHTKKSGEVVPPKFPKFTEAFKAGRAGIFWQNDSDFKCFYIEINDPELEALAVKEIHNWRVGAGRAYLKAHGITVALEDIKAL